MTIFSVLLPFTNDLPALQATLSSLHAQTHSDWECICVNSDDAPRSGLWLMAQSEADPRILPSTNPGSGDIAAVRYGLNLAEEKPVLICSAGEEFAPDFLRRLQHDALPPSGSKPPLMMTETAMQFGKSSSSKTNANDPTESDLHSVRTHLARLGLPVHRYGWLRLLPKTMTNADNASHKTTPLHGAIGRVAQAMSPIASFLTSGFAGRSDRLAHTALKQDHSRGVTPQIIAAPQARGRSVPRPARRVAMGSGYPTPAASRAATARLDLQER